MKSLTAKDANSELQASAESYDAACVVVHSQLAEVRQRYEDLKN